MKRFALFCTALSAGILLATSSTSATLSKAGDKQSGIAAGHYTGACQVMTIGSDGTVMYDDTPLGICHVEVTGDDLMKAEFPDPKRGRGKWNTVTLRLASTEPRDTWTAIAGDDEYQVTAIPYSARGYVFRLENIRNGELVAGAQQFFAVNPEPAIALEMP